MRTGTEEREDDEIWGVVVCSCHSVFTRERSGRLSIQIVRLGLRWMSFRLLIRPLMALPCFCVPSVPPFRVVLYLCRLNERVSCRLGKA